MSTLAAIIVNFTIENDIRRKIFYFWWVIWYGAGPDYAAFLNYQGSTG